MVYSDSSSRSGFNFGRSHTVLRNHVASVTRIIYAFSNFNSTDHELVDKVFTNKLLALGY